MKAYKTNRFWQFIFAVLGNMSVRRGPIWWAAHHRHHHRFTDTPKDMHSPKQHGFWWELDITYLILVILSWMGIVWDLRPVPESVKNRLASRNI